MEGPSIEATVVLLNNISFTVDSLILDFDSVQQGVRNGAPRKFAWAAAFGFMLTVVWLYLEILRLVALLSGRR